MAKSSQHEPGDAPEGHDPYALTILRSLDARRPLTKRYDSDATGSAVKTAYTGHKHFAVEEIRALNIQDLAEHMQWLERDPSAAIIRGAPLATTDRSKALRRSNGATATFEDVPRGWFMADLDDVPLPASVSVTADPHEVAAHLVDLLTGFAPDLVDVTAVVQFSSSAGIADIAEAEAVAGLPPRWAGVAKPGNRVGGHIWFMLARPESSAAVKRWALGVNARAGKKLIDPALFQSIHLHYVAAPIFGQGLRDPLAGRRVQIVQGLEDAATLTIPEFSTAPLRGATADFAGWGNGFAGGGFEARLAAIGTTGFHAEINAAVASYVASHWPTVDTEWLVAALQARILAAPPGDRSEAQIAAYAASEALQRRIEWAMAREAEKHEAQAAEQARPIDPTYPDYGVPLAEGQAQAKTAVARFGDLIRTGEAPEHLLRVSVGTGKSHAAIEALPELLEAARMGQGIRKRRAEIEKMTLQARIRAAASDPTEDAPPEKIGPPSPPKPGKGAVFYLVPRHQLGDEIVARIRKAHPGLTVATWRGLDAQDPEIDGATMCLDRELTRAAGLAGLGETAPCVACPLRDQCGYRRQRKQKADIWIAAHNLAFSDKPEGLPDAGCIVVDESFYQAGLHGLDGLPVQMVVAALDEDRTGDVTGVDQQRLLNLRALVKRAIEGQGTGQLHRSGFEREELTADSLGEMRALEWRTKPTVDLSDCRDRGGIMEAMKGLGGQGFTPLRAMLATQLEAFLSRRDARCVGLELDLTAETGRGQGTAPAVKMAWRNAFKGWCSAVPKLLLDATTAPELVRIWCPALVVTDIEVSAPHQHVTQVFDREFGKKWFETASNVAAVADLAITELARTDGQVLLILQQVGEDLVRAELARRSGGLSNRLHLAHHGNLTGLDGYGDVATLIVVGRPTPNRLTGERNAEVIRGGAVERVPNADDAWWPQAEAGLRMADGTGQRVETSRHPDPLVEAARWTIAEGAVIQAIGRARGVRRTEANRVRVVVLGNMPLPMTVTTATTWEDFKPGRVEVAIAEAAMAGTALPLGAADLAAARPDIWRNAGQVADDLRGVNRISLIEPIYKQFPIYSAHYWKPGTFRPSLALVPAAGGQAALEAVLGVKLARFDWLEPPPAAEQATKAEPQLKPRARPAAKPEPLAEPAGAAVMVLGEAPPFDPIPAPPPPPQQRDFLFLRLAPAPDTAVAPKVDTSPTPDARERLACLSRRLFQVRPPRPSNDGMNAVRMAHWLERCAQARQEHWRGDLRAAPMADSA